jgi:hypothetical protein
MRQILQLASWLSLAAIIGPAIMYYSDKMELSTLKTTMLVATISWFIATSLWMGREKPTVTEETPSSVV